MPKSVTIDPEVGAILARCEVSGNLVILPKGQLERDLYVRVDKVLKALGGKWDRKAGGHVFARGIGPDLAAALAAGEAVDQKRTREQFFTPEETAEHMADMLGIDRGAHVLEPSAGEGRLVAAARAAGAEIVTAVEIDERLCGQMVEANREHGLYVFCADFLQWTPISPVPIDFVMMNPPFSRNQDIAHVRRAFDLLRPGGRLASIMSPHFTYAEDAPSREFRDLIGYPHRTQPGRGLCMGNSDLVRECLIEQLPERAFRAEGTDISTVLVMIEKPR